MASNSKDSTLAAKQLNKKEKKAVAEIENSIFYNAGDEAYLRTPNFTTIREAIVKSHETGERHTFSAKTLVDFFNESFNKRPMYFVLEILEKAKEGGLITEAPVGITKAAAV